MAAEERLLHRMRAGLSALPGVNELTLWGLDHPRIGIVRFTVSGVDLDRLAQKLSDRHGIGVRCGKFCAHLFMRHLLGAQDDDTGCRDGGVGGIRASFGIGATDEHVDRLVSAVSRS